MRAASAKRCQRAQAQRPRRQRRAGGSSRRRPRGRTSEKWSSRHTPARTEWCSAHRELASPGGAARAGGAAFDTGRGARGISPFCCAPQLRVTCFAPLPWRLRWRLARWSRWTRLACLAFAWRWTRAMSLLFNACRARCACSLVTTSSGATCAAATGSWWSRERRLLRPPAASGAQASLVLPTRCRSRRVVAGSRMRRGKSRSAGTRTSCAPRARSLPSAAGRAHTCRPSRRRCCPAPLRRRWTRSPRRWRCLRCTLLCA